MPLPERPQIREIERLPAKDDIAQIEPSLRLGAGLLLGEDELAERRRRLVQHRHPSSPRSL